MAHGRPVHREFSLLCPSEPRSLLDRVRDVVRLASGTLLTDNANISVLPLGDGRVLCLTEATKGSVLLDPETLDTIGKFRYADRLWGLLQSVHPVVTGTELLTLLPDIFAWPSCRQDGSREQREESDWESALPWRARTGMGAFVRRHGELHRHAGDAPPILPRRRSQVSADTLVSLRLATGVWELHARHMQVHRKDSKHY